MSSILMVGEADQLKFIIRALASRGHSVTAIVENAEESRKLAEAVNAVVVAGDGTLPDTLREAGIADADRVFALASQDETNFLVCLIARRRFGITDTFALIRDPDNEAIFEELDLGATFSVTEAVADLIDRRSFSESVRNLRPIADGRFGLTEAALDQRSPAVGKALRDLRLPNEALLVSVVRGETASIPRGDTRLEIGDRVGFIYAAEVYAETLSAIVGKD